LKLDATLRGIAPEEVVSWAQRCEALGFDGLFSTETNNDPFLPLALAAGGTERVELGTGVALAFPRSPMQVAYTGWDLQGLTRGRFVLGLGSQVRAHVERRFSAPWDRPGPRMRDFARAVRAIWTAWADGTPLDYQGEFYRHTLMPPDFRPRPHDRGVPPIMLAGVRPRMIEIAGEVADGLLVHPLQTPRYLRDTVLGAIERGLERSGRSRSAFELSVCLFTATTDEETEAVRRRIAFYASTPGYRHVLEPDGWGELCERLHRLSRTGGWDAMPGLVPDELLDSVCVRGVDGAAVAAGIARRYAGLADRVNLHVGRRADPGRWAGLAAALPDAVGAAEGAAARARP
jgi:probable F420-dependent oxidoreductase